MAKKKKKKKKRRRQSMKWRALADGVVEGLEV
jgi:hypothetical protein